MSRVTTLPCKQASNKNNHLGILSHRAGQVVAIKNSPAREGRTKNEHMKSPRTGVHPAQTIIGDSIPQSKTGSGN
jgi:hypothetical protein